MYAESQEALRFGVLLPNNRKDVPVWRKTTTPRNCFIMFTTTAARIINLSIELARLWIQSKVIAA